MVDTVTYLGPVINELKKQHPDNRAVNIVCHGHSVPAGYFATPLVDTFHSYPHLLHVLIKERFPFSIVNVIVTAIGGENSAQGAQRFDAEVLNHKPDAITIDYSLNDRGIGLERAREAWGSMIEKALANNVKVILLTPSWEQTYFGRDGVFSELWNSLAEHSGQVRDLARAYSVGLADAFKRFGEYVKKDSDLADLLSHQNHPNRIGHQIIADEIGKYFVAYCEMIH